MRKFKVKQEKPVEVLTIFQLSVLFYKMATQVKLKILKPFINKENKLFSTPDHSHGAIDGHEKSFEIAGCEKMLTE